eukprot:4329012-Amphidinium_carterae.1
MDAVMSWPSLPTCLEEHRNEQCSALVQSVANQPSSHPPSMNQIDTTQRNSDQRAVLRAQLWRSTPQELGCCGTNSHDVTGSYSYFRSTFIQEPMSKGVTSLHLRSAHASVLGQFWCQPWIM